VFAAGDIFVVFLQIDIGDIGTLRLLVHSRSRGWHGLTGSSVSHSARVANCLLFPMISQSLPMRVICLFALTLSVGTVFAQQGTIRYEGVQRTEISLEAVKSFLPAEAMEGLDSSRIEAIMEQVSNTASEIGWETWFDGQSVLGKMILPEMLQGFGGGGPPATTPFVGLGTSGQNFLESVTFIDYENGTVAISVPSGMAEPYVITGNMREMNIAIDWVLGDRDSTIMGYAVRHATLDLDSLSAEAWFAPDLASPVGPMNLGGLPGAILHLNAEVSMEGMVAIQSSFLADSISSELKTPVAPPAGVEITVQNYEALLQQRLKMMREEEHEHHHQ